MRKILKIGIVSAILGIAILIGTINVCFIIRTPDDADKLYHCDVNLISLGLNIDIEDKSGNRVYEIEGEIFSKYEDDLKMRNMDDTIVRATDDKYNLISQNEHIITDGNKTLYICDGKIKIFADSYDVYDAEEKKLAKVRFNMFDTSGTMEDMNGNVIATYHSALSRKDYAVAVYDTSIVDEESTLMIFASYVSDVRADNKNSK